MRIVFQDKKAEIAFQNVSFSYGDRPILENVTFEVNTGEIFAIVGQCGFGKSTILKLCCGLLKPLRGNILLKGRSTGQISREELLTQRLDIGYVFQNSALISNLNVFDNIALPLRYHTDYPSQKISEVVQSRVAMMQLEGYESAMPHSLSMGLMKRTAAARALALMPSLMMYDEPTSGLDPINAALLNNLVKTLHQGFGITSLIVTHDLRSAISLATKVALVGNKTILFCGPPEELQSSQDPYIMEFLKNA